MTSITIRPERPAIDTPLEVRVDGLPPGGTVTIGATSGPMGSTATFEADATGSVDLSTSAPIAGSYEDADPMGLVWSMTPIPGSAAAASHGDLPPSTLALTAEVAGGAGAVATVDRLRLPDDITREVVRARGLVGTLFHPLDDGPRPGVILLGGSEGGLHEMDAALLAAHGFSVLALAYFGAEGVSPFLVNIPLEYFGTAIGFLQAHESVGGERLGVIGGSRGGEAALLIGSTFPAIGAVVSTVGSGVVTQGIGPGRDLLEMAGTPVPSWCWRGSPLPYLRNQLTPELRRQVADGEPVELGRIFEPGMADEREVEACTIEVGRIRGPVLLVTGGDDRMWPSGPMSEIAARRLAAAGLSHEHLRFADAGHPIAPPPFGPTTELLSPGPGVMFAMGGTPHANAHARAEAWRRSIEFLGDALGG
ncbi:MAG TPA: acyl-CoA thioester hydrolase/BAAT C-terminal domain-containing protein [Candidatus Limnocylindrales bacterium]|nr:acyl-CoA thioester hydrolase/BAAT C-terminal domain-containing protein [Candidatus Limnocylindrales bacterium]